MKVDHSRRQFLQVMAASSVGAVLFTGCAVPDQALQEQSQVQQQPEDLAAADETWYATTCRVCPSGCGMLARVVQGRVHKVEGNPLHPVNQGKLCARGQATVQEEYHPDRVTGPLLRQGDRGGGSWTSITWDEALNRLGAALDGPRAAGQAGSSVAFLTNPPRGHQAFLLDRFTSATGAGWLTLPPLGEVTLRQAVKQVYGQTTLPTFDVANARTVLAFGANFLETWLSPVQYGVAYGIFRQGDYRAGSFQPRGQRPRGHLTYFGPQFNGTAAAADQWVYVNPGYEGIVALSIAQVIGANGGTSGALDAYAPETVASATGVAADRIRAIAAEFASNGPSLAIGGGEAGAHANGTQALTAILSLNSLVGSLGKPGGVIFNPPPPLPDQIQPRLSATADWQQLIQALNARTVSTLLVHGANPVHDLPAALGFEAALQQASTVIAFSSFLDDTARLADLVLPIHLPLEDWGDDVPESTGGVPAVSLQQPVVRPLHDTRSFGDLLLAVAAELGGPLQQALPWPSYKSLLQQAVTPLAQSQGQNSTAPAVSPEQAFNTLLQRGVWTAPSTAAPAPPPASAVQAAAAAAASVPAPTLAGDAGTYPYVLVPYVHNTLGEGSGAHLPWLQATPDPITSAVWQTWINVSPGLATRLNLREGDVVRVESTQGAVEVPVYVNPAAPPGVLSMPLGQGHSGSDRWSTNRGVNPLQVVVPTLDASSGDLAYAATRVRLTPTGRATGVPKLEGDVPAYQLPGKEVLKVTNG